MTTKKKRAILLEILGFMFGRCVTFAINPIGMGYFLCLYGHDVNKFVLGTSILLGMATVLESVEVIKYGLVMGTVTIILHLMQHTGKKVTVSARCISGGIVTAVLALSKGAFSANYRTYLLLSLLEGGLAGISAYLLEKGCAYILYHKKRESMSNQELISVGMMAGIFVYTLPEWEFRGISVPWILVYMIVFLAGYKYSAGERSSSYMTQNIQMVTNNKFKDFSASLTRLSQAFLQFSKPKQTFGTQEVNDIFEEISEKFCKDCVRCEECWSRNYNVTYESAQAIFTMAKENGCIAEEDVPLEFMKRCINVKAFVRETNKSLEIARVNLNWYNKLRESREAVAEQLDGMAQIMKEFAADVCEIKEIRNEKEEQMLAKLKSCHIDVKRLIMVENSQKRIEIHIIAKMKKGRCVTSREVAVMLGQILGIRMRPGDYTKNVVPRESEVMVFVEDAKYKTLTGVARKSKEGEEISGDNFSFLQLGTGQMVMMLSDGMGSGKEANAESEEVIELLEQMIETGIREKTAIQLVNSLYALWSDSNSFSTIDMGIIDLYTGNSSFIKQGAAATFIKRKDGIERIETASLPAGMFQKLEVESSSMQLEDGDFVVMVTDGILDSFPGEEKEASMELVLSEIKNSNPQEIADKIMGKAMEVSDKTREDDMTVLVAGVWEKL